MEQRLSPKDTALLVHIEYSKPIEVNDFVATIGSIRSLYTSFVKKNAECQEMVNAKLYVEKIEKGSIDIHFCELASAALIPFIENTNTILDFAQHIKDVVSFFVSGKGEEPKFSVADLKALHGLFSVTAHDRESSTSIGAINKTKNGNIYNNCTFNYTDSNSAQNQVARREQEIAKPIETEDIRKNQLMTIHQMVGDMSLDKGNKAVIDAISTRKVGLLFEDDEIKHAILHMDGNPTKKAFYVDISLMYANGKLAAYKVMKLHDIIDIEDD